MRDIYNFNNHFKCEWSKISIKRQWLTKWIIKTDPTDRFLQETHLQCKDSGRLKVITWRTIEHANTNQKETGVAILMFLKTSFRISKNYQD